MRIRFSEAFTRLLVLALIGFGPLSAWAQNAKLAGKVIDKATKEPIPFAAIKLFSGGALKGGSIADFDGNYSISPVNPGTYDLEASAVGYTPYKLEKITIAFEETKR
ncbi:MAG TPA: carboxypeptidase-like regulatory domain-containing protein, partial [Catalimonadaceae bacterium]|nr:carboxypeptidase-like regulatory domain-containing protein [Catalimonadaceae bacterium]